MKSASEDVHVGLAVAVLCLTVIGGISWWQGLPKTVPLKLDIAGRTVFHGDLLNRVGER